MQSLKFSSFNRDLRIQEFQLLRMIPVLRKEFRMPYVSIDDFTVMNGMAPSIQATPADELDIENDQCNREKYGSYRTEKFCVPAVI